MASTNVTIYSFLYATLKNFIFYVNNLFTS